MTSTELLGTLTVTFLNPASDYLRGILLGVWLQTFVYKAH